MNRSFPASVDPMKKIVLLSLFVLVALSRPACAFVAPSSRHGLRLPLAQGDDSASSHHVRLHALPLSSSASIPLELASASLSRHASSILVAAADDIGIDEAFTDEINLFGDPFIQKMFGVFGVVIVLLLAANALLGQMDGAIQNVLGDFERAMRTRYASRWIEIEEELEGMNIDSETESPERTEALMKIMERMEREEPKLMERVNAEMSAYK